LQPELVAFKVASNSNFSRINGHCLNDPSIWSVPAWYEPHLDRIHEDAENHRDLLQLEQIASG
jgi:hypothetical protein